MSAPESRSQRLEKVAALSEPLRRGIYLFVSSSPAAVSRDEAAAEFSVSRAVAAFHLDKLADLGLLSVSYQRPAGRTGPGAGRPSKLYAAAAEEVSFSVPPREYELAGRVLAEAVSVSSRDGVPVADAVSSAARSVGESLGRSASSVSEVLTSCGYSPVEDGDEIVLRNCPFHALASDYRDLVCGMNLSMLAGVTTAIAGSRLEARLDPHPGECCVRLRKS